MSEHGYTLAEYDALHAAVGMSTEWLASDRRRETEREITCGLGPGGLRRPMMGCGYVDQDDGCCTHPLNPTPECMSDTRCPVLELRVPR